MSTASNLSPMRAPYIEEQRNSEELRDESQKTAQLPQVLDAAKFAHEVAPYLLALQKKTVAIDSQNSFRVESLDLSASDIAFGVGKLIPRGGYGLLYHRESSSPHASLLIEMGGRLQRIYPGSFIKGYFEKLTVSLGANNFAALGTANLIVCASPDATFEEANASFPYRFDPVALLGTVSTTLTFSSAVTVDTQPSGASQTGAFNITGWRRIRVLIDGTSGADTLTSCTLVPWLREEKSGTWLEQGTESIGIPDSRTTAYRYRVFVVEVRGNGQMFFEIRDAAGAPGNPASLKFIVQGIE